ncbi:hypothetical protein [Marinobacter sp. es.048]|uniref:hypothetical protein n=1 Tax=Marinobacter sp. es.048 TaxID=1761795 RepID=UPI001E2C1EF9
MITGIGWVSELIGIAGGEDIFPERAAEPSAQVAPIYLQWQTTTCTRSSHR